MCSVSVHCTHFWCSVWKVFCFCPQYTFLMYCLHSVLFLCTVDIFDVPSRNILFLCTVHIFYVPSRKHSVSVHSTHFWCTIWKASCVCAQYTFLICCLKVFFFFALYTFLKYRLENVLFPCTLHISDVRSGKCSVSVHSTYFWCIVWKVFLFCTQYTFVLYRLENFIFFCALHISDVCSGKCSVPVYCTLFWCPVMWYFFK